MSNQKKVLIEDLRFQACVCVRGGFDDAAKLMRQAADALEANELNPLLSADKSIDPSPEALAKLSAFIAREDAKRKATAYFGKLTGGRDLGNRHKME